MRSDRLLVLDILDAIAEVNDTMPAAQNAFDADKLIRSHVVRHIQIIGEAVSRLSQPLKDRYPTIPWRLIAGMRHVIVHDYYQIDWNEVFNAATLNVPPLKKHIESILAALPISQ